MIWKTFYLRDAIDQTGSMVEFSHFNWVLRHRRLNCLSYFDTSEVCAKSVFCSSDDSMYMSVFIATRFSLGLDFSINRYKVCLDYFPLTEKFRQKLESHDTNL